MFYWFVGALAYADDIVLLALTASAMRARLNSCDLFAKQYNIIFNGNKSKVCIFHQSVALHVVHIVHLYFVLMEVL